MKKSINYFRRLHERNQSEGCNCFTNMRLGFPFFFTIFVIHKIVKNIYFSCMNAFLLAYPKIRIPSCMQLEMYSPFSRKLK